MRFNVALNGIQKGIKRNSTDYLLDYQLLTINNVNALAQVAERCSVLLDEHSTFCNVCATVSVGIRHAAASATSKIRFRFIRVVCLKF